MKTIVTSLFLHLMSMVACMAGLTFDKTLAEFHTTLGTPFVTADFAFRNDGEKTARIVKFDAACSCVDINISKGKLEYAPGESGAIRAVFKLAGYYGTVDRIVAIWLDGDPPAEPSARLTVRAHIPQVINIQPKTLNWNLNGEPSPQSMIIEMDANTKIHVLEAKSSSPNFTTELKTHVAGRKYEIIVTPKSTATPGITAVRIHTDSEIESLRTHNAFGVIRNPPR